MAGKIPRMSEMEFAAYRNTALKREAARARYCEERAHWLLRFLLVKIAPTIKLDDGTPAKVAITELLASCEPAHKV